MKNIRILINIAAWVILLASCDDNDIMPAFEKRGATTATVATITPSNASPTVSESITLTLDAVNPESDPIKTIVLRAKVGAGSYVDLQTFDEQSSPKNAEISHEVTYVAPATSGEVTFEMVITSQKEYAQVNRASITVQ